MSAVPPHVDEAVRRPAHVAGEVVAERREGLPTILAGGLLTGWIVCRVRADQWSVQGSSMARDADRIELLQTLRFLRAGFDALRFSPAMLLYAELAFNVLRETADHDK
jgi:hypothetical protein